MPTLNWIGKSDVQDHHKTIPYKVLEKDKKLSIGNTKNMLIQGDNLLALKSLLPYYKGKIKCIYIDPPYNTGNESWIYNDKVNSPTIQEWLNKTVGKPDEDLSMHDKWLCMMYPRLYLLRELLADDGVIFISIDEHEVANLKLLCNETFGNNNFRNSFIVRRYDKNINLQFAKKGLTSYNVGFEYVLMYSKNLKTKLKPLYRIQSEKRRTTGYWKGFWNDADRPTMRYDLFGVIPEKGQWKLKKESALVAVKNYEIYVKEFSKLMTLEEYWKKTGKTKKFIRKRKNGQGLNKGVEQWIPPTEWILRNTLWQDIFASKPTKSVEFNNPKNPDMIKEIIKSIVDKDDIILDSFAGSGTTAQSVMELNEKDKGNRKFILIEMESNIARSVTHKRLNTVVKDLKSKRAPPPSRKTTNLVSIFILLAMIYLIVMVISQNAPFQI